jgi:hypothetical protein
VNRSIQWKRKKSKQNQESCMRSYLINIGFYPPDPTEVEKGFHTKQSVERDTFTNRLDKVVDKTLLNVANCIAEKKGAQEENVKRRAKL